jgi:hypothetical protein
MLPCCKPSAIPQQIETAVSTEKRSNKQIENYTRYYRHGVQEWTEVDRAILGMQVVKTRCYGVQTCSRVRRRPTVEYRPGIARQHGSKDEKRCSDALPFARLMAHRSRLRLTRSSLALSRFCGLHPVSNSLLLAPAVGARQFSMALPRSPPTNVVILDGLAMVSIDGKSGMKHEAHHHAELQGIPSSPVQRWRGKRL